MSLPKFAQIDAGLDVGALLFDLQRQDLWNKNPCRLSKRGPHHETEDIFLRYKDETPHIDSGDWSSFSAEHFPDWYEAVDRLPSALPIIFALMARVRGEMLGGVFIYRVRPGQQIYQHTDNGWHPRYFDKFNVCLTSNPQAAFVYDDCAMKQNAGDIHWFRNDVPHSVVNEGKGDHIVMTVCIRIDQGKRVPFSPEGWTMDGSRAMREGGL